ncbi:hypothetical protein ACL6C3_28300 [Capilliphycus salinus ALCB114379]|uniref:hypothetical protein n=1 Tax=Capilliphycus salinus TaxID=2768948 RepID=UPI0039A448F1
MSIDHFSFNEIRTELQANIIPVMQQLNDIRQRTEQTMMSVAALYNHVDHAVASVYQRLLLSNQPHDSKLVIGRFEHRIKLLKILEEAQEKVWIISPWTSKNGFDEPIIEGMNNCLQRRIPISIGWGFQGDIGTLIKPQNSSWTFTGLPWQYSAMPELRKLKCVYPDEFQLKLIGTHAKVFMNEQFAVVGSYNILCSKPKSEKDLYEELGLITTSPCDLQTLRDWFDNAPNYTAG